MSPCAPWREGGQEGARNLVRLVFSDGDREEAVLDNGNYIDCGGRSVPAAEAFGMGRWVAAM